MTTETIEAILRLQAPSYHDVTLLTPLDSSTSNVPIIYEHDGSLCFGVPEENEWLPIANITATPGGLVLLESVVTDRDGNQRLEAMILTAAQVRAALEGEKF